MIKHSAGGGMKKRLTAALLLTVISGGAMATPSAPMEQSLMDKMIGTFMSGGTHKPPP